MRRRAVNDHRLCRLDPASTWNAPESMVAIRAAASLLLDSISSQALPEGKIDYKDPATVQKYLVAEAGAPVRVRKYDEQAGNQYLILLDHIVY